MLGTGVGEHLCREVLGKSVVAKGCGEVLWRSVVVVWYCFCGDVVFFSGFVFLWLCLVAFLFCVLGVLRFLSCRGMLRRHVGEECCREGLWRSVAEKCCEGVLWRSVVVKC